MNDRNKRGSHEVDTENTKEPVWETLLFFPFNLICWIVNFVFNTILLFPKVMWWILFKKEQREIGVSEKVLRNMVSVYLYVFAVMLILEGMLVGCGVHDPEFVKEDVKCSFQLFMGISAEALQTIPKECCGFIHICIGLVLFVMAHRMSVRRVCKNCHLNRGVRKVGAELVHEGNWVPVRGSDGKIQYEQENIYKNIYQCKECDWGYTSTGTEIRRK